MFTIDIYDMINLFMLGCPMSQGKSCFIDIYGDVAGIMPYVEIGDVKKKYLKFR